MFYPSMTAALPYVKSGKLKALGMTALTRSPLAPEIPTVSESGIAGYQANIWNGMLAPAATPRALIARLNQELVRVLSTPKCASALPRWAQTPRTARPRSFARSSRPKRRNGRRSSAKQGCASNSNGEVRRCAGCNDCAPARSSDQPPVQKCPSRSARICRRSARTASFTFLPERLLHAWLVPR